VIFMVAVVQQKGREGVGIQDDDVHTAVVVDVPESGTTTRFMKK